MNNKIYIGDSVYAQFDDYRGIILTTENGLPNDPSNKIILEASVYETLLLFVESQKNKMEGTK